MITQMITQKITASPLTASPEIATLDDVPYLYDMTFGQFLAECRIRHPALYHRLRLSHLSKDDLCRRYELLEAMPSHFESNSAGGRGDAYRNEQKRSPLIRARGIKALFDLLKEPEKHFSVDELILDVIGGNGTLTRAMRCLLPPPAQPTIITSDPSSAMIADALSQGLMAIRQPAQSLLLADATIDGAIFAYGTHHIPPEERQTSLREAYRVLKPGARVVFQDFEECTPTARWYSELLDRYTSTGHKFAHFTRQEMNDLLINAGFTKVRVLDVYDPFVVMDRTAEMAQQQLLKHVCSLFSLQKLPVDIDQCDAAGWRRIEEIVRPYGTFAPESIAPELGAPFEPGIRTEADHYIAEFPRIALVAVGTKPE